MSHVRHYLIQEHKLIIKSLSSEARDRLNYQYEIVLLSILPWFHVYGLMSMVQSCCAGVRLIMLPKFEEDSFLQSIEKYKPTSSFMVPPLMVFMAKHPLVDKYDMTSLKELYCGAAPLSREVEEAVLKRLPHVSVKLNGKYFWNSFTHPLSPSRSFVRDSACRRRHLA